MSKSSGQWGYVGKAPPHSSKSRTTRPSSSNASHLPTMHNNTSGIAETPVPPPTSSKRTFGSRTSFLRRDDAGPSPAGPLPVPSIPAPPAPSVPQLRVPDTTRSIVARPSAVPVAADAPGNPSVTAGIPSNPSTGIRPTFSTSRASFLRRGNPPFPSEPLQRPEPTQNTSQASGPSQDISQVALNATVSDSQPVPPKQDTSGGRRDAYHARKDAIRIIKRCEQLVNTLEDFIGEIGHHRENMMEAYDLKNEDL